MFPIRTIPGTGQFVNCTESLSAAAGGRAIQAPTRVEDHAPPRVTSILRAIGKIVKNRLRPSPKAETQLVDNAASGTPAELGSAIKAAIRAKHNLGGRVNPIATPPEVIQNAVCPLAACYRT